MLSGDYINVPARHKVGRKKTEICRLLIDLAPATR